MGVQGYDRNITSFLKDSNPLESSVCVFSELGVCTGTCGAATKSIGVPMFEERSGVGVHEACKPPKGVSGTIRAVVVVPARHLALVLRATHVRGDAEYGLMDVAVAEATAPVTWAVLDLMIQL